MVVETDGAGVIGSTVGGVAEEETARVLFFLRSVFGLLLKFAGKLKPLIHYHIFIPIKRGRKQQRFACLNYGYQCLFCKMPKLDVCIVLCPPQQRRQKCLLAFLSVTTKDRL